MQVHVTALNLPPYLLIPHQIQVTSILQTHYLSLSHSLTRSLVIKLHTMLIPVQMQQKHTSKLPPQHLYLRPAPSRPCLVGLPIISQPLAVFVPSTPSSLTRLKLSLLAPLFSQVSALSPSSSRGSFFFFKTPSSTSSLLPTLVSASPLRRVLLEPCGTPEG